MLFELLNQCLGIDCRELIAAAWGVTSTAVYYVSNAVARA